MLRTLETAVPPDVRRGFARVLRTLETATPPDVRRGSAPPLTHKKTLGLCPSFGHRPNQGLSPNQGHSPSLVVVTLTAGRSPASHQAA